MSFSAGHKSYFSIDSLGGSPTDISSFLRSVGGFHSKTARHITTALGARAQRRQVLGLRDGGPISLSGLFNPAGSFLHGKNAAVLVDQYAASAYFRQATISRVVSQGETHTFGDSWRERGSPGLMDGSVRLEGIYDPTALLGSDVIIRDLLAQEAAGVLSIGLNGTTLGNVAELGGVVAGEYMIPTDVDTNPVPVSVSFEGDDAFDTGVWIHELGAETGTEDGASVDETAATAFGGVAHLNITAVSGSGSITVKVQHSTNDSVWADLITFTAATAIGAERALTAAITTTVNRYVRYSISAFSGFTSVTLAVCFARRGYVSATTGRHRYWASMLANAFTHPITTYSALYGPQGNATGAPSVGGELVPLSYELSASCEDVTNFSAQLAVTGALSDSVF